MSGYDIKQLFDSTMAPMWNTAHSQIYNELRRMSELGWVEMERHEQEARPDKKVYQATAQGLAALREWQFIQPARGLQMRDEVLLRFTFGSFAAPKALAATLRGGLADHEQRLALYRHNQQHLPYMPQNDVNQTQPDAATAPDPFFELLARFAIMFEETYLRWLREALAFVERRVDQARTNEER
jgi:PadR family transcriptional regulator AphA